MQRRMTWRRKTIVFEGGPYGMRKALILSLTGLGLSALAAPAMAQDITIAVAGR